MNYGLLVFCFVFAIIAFASAGFSAEISNPLEIQGVTAKVFLEASGSILGNLGGMPVTIKVLSFRETESQKIISIKEYLTINSETILPLHETDSQGNNIAVFETRQTGNFSYFIEAEIETNFSGKKLEDFDLSNGISDFQEFSLPTELVESNDAGILTIAFNEFDSNSLLENIRAVTEWVHDYVSYDTSYVGKKVSAAQVLQEKKGVCEHFSELAAAILRAKKIPVRFAGGSVFSGNQWGNHSWIQAYSPNSGWIDIDPTYGEAGIVDGTHIVLGFFSDPRKAVDTISAASTAKIELSEKKASVRIADSKKFSGIVEITSGKIEGTAMKWIDLNFSVKNKLNGFLIAPVSFAFPEGITADKKDRVFLLKPNEEKASSIRVFADKNLSEKEYLKGEYRVSSLMPEFMREITIKNAEEENSQAKIELVSISPVIAENRLLIEAVLENIGNQGAEVFFSITGNGIDFTRAENIGGLEKKTILLEIRDYAPGNYEIRISGNEIDFRKTLVIKEAETPIFLPEKEPEKKENQAISGEIIFAAAIIAALAAGFVLFKAVKK